MKRLNKLGMSLAVVSALSLGFTGCGSSSSVSDAFTGLGEYAVKVTRGDVYQAEVKDSASPAHIAVQIEGTNEYKFDVSEEDIVFPVVATGGYVDVDGNGKIEADIDMKLNMDLKSYTADLTPVTTYLADEVKGLTGAKLDAELDAKLQELVDLVKDTTDVDAFSADDLLKPATETSKDAQIVINAIYAEMVEAKDNGEVELDLSLDSLKSKFEDRLNELDALDFTGTAKDTAAKLEAQVVKDLDIKVLTADDVQSYLDDLKATALDFDAIKKVSDLQGKTVYTINDEAKTYTEIKLSTSIGTDTVLETTTYKAVDGKFEELKDGAVTAEATLDKAHDELTLIVNDGEQEIKNVIDEISLDGLALDTELSLKELGASLNMDASYSKPEKGEIYLEMNAQMKADLLK